MPFWKVLSLLRKEVLCELPSDISFLLSSPGKKTLSERISWAVQAARGMKYLHSRVPAVVHADIKSMNFLLNGAGVVKITDFGLALSRTDTSMRQQSRQAGAFSCLLISWRFPCHVDWEGMCLCFFEGEPVFWGWRVSGVVFML